MRRPINAPDPRREAGQRIHISLGNHYIILNKDCAFLSEHRKGGFDRRIADRSH
jgi:hypothetical protein